MSGFAAVNQPTRSAAIPALVGPAGVPAANALTMTVRQVGVIVGPLLAGVLIGLGEPLPRLRGRRAGVPRRRAAAARSAVAAAAGVGGPLRLRAAVRGVGEGFAFLRTQPVLLMTFVVDIIAMLFAWPQAVFPELSETRFEESPNSLGWLFAGISIGALLMGLTSGWVSRVDRQGAVVLGAIAVWGVAIIGFGLAPSLWLAVLCLAVAGAGDMVSAVLRTSMLQKAAPDEMRGRMQGVFLVVVAGGPRLGDLRAGAMASAAGGERGDGVRRRDRRRGDGRRRAVVPSFRLFRASRGEPGCGRPGRTRPPPRVARAGRARDRNPVARVGRHRCRYWHRPAAGRTVTRSDRHQARACATTARSATSAS